jgi:fido (protein-threonine AMPylation protein)
LSPRGRPSRQFILEALDRAKAGLAEVGGLPKPEEAKAIWEGIWQEETHHSTAIEGNTMVLSQVKTLLEKGRAVGNKELAEYLEIQAYAEAAHWVYAQASEVDDWSGRDLVNLTELRQIHRLVVEPVWRYAPPSGHQLEEGPGSFRRHDIEPLASKHVPPPWTDVPALVTDWLAFVSAGPQGVHLVFHLADAHARFERIHPFLDGNGRTGRLVLNLLLVRKGYPPAIIYKSQRAKYLNALRRADKGDPAPLTELLARAVKHSIDRFVLPGLAGPHRMVPLSALAGAQHSLVSLRRAAQRGRLKASSRGGQWYSTKQLVEEYKASRRQGRRKVVPAAEAP